LKTRRIAALGILAILALSAIPQMARAAVPAIGASFLTPSGNIGCMAYSGTLRCDINHKSWQAPVGGMARCPMGSRGLSLKMRATGRPSWPCTSDTVLEPLGSEPVLAYGATWHWGAFACTSRITGLTCSNRSRHGFFLSRQSYRIF
jgi:uncharacterized protein DUF6636